MRENLAFSIRKSKKIKVEAADFLPAGGRQCDPFRNAVWASKSLLKEKNKRHKETESHRKCWQPLGQQVREFRKNTGVVSIR